MELAGLLHRTPRETLRSVTLPEFLAYARLGADRADENDDERREMDLSEADDTEIAAAFGAKMVPRRGTNARQV